MNDYISTFKEDLLILIKKLKSKNIITKDFNIDNLSIDFQSKSKQGDVSSNILIILKRHLINKDYLLEKEICKNISKFSYIKNIEVAKVGFLNIFFDENYIIEKINEVFSNPKKYGNNNYGNKKKINVEFVSANPTGPLHIGHIRGAILGDVVSSMLECSGYIVTREYYVNDAGSQISILGNSLFKRYKQIAGIDTKINDNEYPGEYLIEIAKKIYDKDKIKWLNEEENIRKIFFENYAVSELLDKIKYDLSLLDIKFDKFTHESAIVREKIIDKIFSILENKKLLYEGFLEKPKGDENSDWSPRKQLLFKSSKFSDDNDRPFKKENGEWTYFANDAAYHYNKFSRNFDHLINIWGSDHIGYIPRMKSITQVFSENSNYLEIHVCQIVRLIKQNKILKMSKRENNFITLSDLYNQVGKDPIRYFMVATKNETPMDFNIDKVIEKNKDNPSFYCQYAYARASSVINKSKDHNEFKNLFFLLEQFNFSYISKYEKEIILKIIAWPYLLNQAIENRQPHRITNYIEELSSSFHSFWNRGIEDKSLRILNLDNKVQTITKLLWIESFRIVLKKAFDILGIESLEEM